MPRMTGGIWLSTSHPPVWVYASLFESACIPGMHLQLYVSMSSCLQFQYNVGLTLPPWMSCRVIAVWQGPVLQLFAFFLNYSSLLAI
jgi:hypothetical protein